jgi:hypothetical protein
MSQESSRLVGGAAVEEAVATVRARALIVVAIVLIGLVAGIVVGADKQSEGPNLRMLVKLSPIGENTTAVALGVSAPQGPLAADFVSDHVFSVLSRVLDRSRDELETQIGIESAGEAREQLYMVVVGDSSSSRRLLRTWYLTVQHDQRAIISNAIEQTRKGYVRELDDLEPLHARVVATENIARLSGLEGSLRTTVSILRGPKDHEPVSRSFLFYVIVGLAGGLVAGLGVALGVGLLERRLRTPAALAAQFGLPIVADVREGSRDDRAGLAERLRVVAGNENRPSLVIVEAGPEGSSRTVAAAVEQISSPLAVGSVGSAEAQAGLAGGSAWVLAVSPGSTRSDQAAEVRAELSGLPRRPLGLILV